MYDEWPRDSTQLCCLSMHYPQKLCRYSLSTPCIACFGRCRTSVTDSTRHQYRQRTLHRGVLLCCCVPQPAEGLANYRQDLVAKPNFGRDEVRNRLVLGALGRSIYKESQFGTAAIHSVQPVEYLSSTFIPWHCVSAYEARRLDRFF